MDWGIFFVTTASNWLLLMFESFEKGRRFASCYRIAKNILPIYWLSGSRRRVGISNWLFVWLRSWWRRSWRSIVFLTLEYIFKSLNPILNSKFFVVCKRMQLTIVVDYFFSILSLVLVVLRFGEVFVVYCWNHKSPHAKLEISILAYYPLLNGIFSGHSRFGKIFRLIEDV